MDKQGTPEDDTGRTYESDQRIYEYDGGWTMDKRLWLRRRLTDNEWDGD